MGAARLREDVAEIFGSPWSLPEVFQWSNFARAWDKGVGQYLLNSVIVVTGGVLLTMLLGSMAAYVLARYRFPGNRFIFYLFAAGMMFPVFLAIVPLFFVVQNLGMLSTYQGLILVYVAYSLPFTVFFMHAFFRTLPTAIAEAAFIDGCSHAGVFFQVMLPMAKPGLLSIGIFNVIGQFNQFVLPSFLSPERPVLTQGIATLLASQRYEGDWGALFAALTIAMVPIVVVYLLFYRQVQAGLTSATLKARCRWSANPSSTTRSARSRAAGGGRSRSPPAPRRCCPGWGSGSRSSAAGRPGSWPRAYASLRESTGQGETDAFAASEPPRGRRYDRVVAITRSVPRPRSSRCSGRCGAAADAGHHRRPRLGRGRRRRPGAGARLRRRTVGRADPFRHHHPRPAPGQPR